MSSWNKKVWVSSFKYSRNVKIKKFSKFLYLCLIKKYILDHQSPHILDQQSVLSHESSSISLSHIHNLSSYLLNASISERCSSTKKTDTSLAGVSLHHHPCQDHHLQPQHLCHLLHWSPGVHCVPCYYWSCSRNISLDVETHAQSLHRKLSKVLSTQIFPWILSYVEEQFLKIKYVYNLKFKFIFSVLFQQWI